MNQYDIVCYYKKKLILSYVKEPPGKNKVKIVLPNNRLTTVKHKNIIYVYKTDFLESESENEVLCYLKNLDKKICQEKSNIDINLIFSNLIAETKYSFDEILDLWMGNEDHDLINELKLLKAISEDSIHFRITGRHIIALSPVEVDKNILIYHKKLSKQKESDNIKSDFQKILNDEKEQISENKLLEYETSLNSYLIYKKGSSNYKFINSILNRLTDNGNLEYTALKIRKKLSPFSYCSVLLQNDKISSLFDYEYSDKIKNRIKEIKQKSEIAIEKKYESGYVFTIDEDSTEDYDDAFSIKKISEGKYRIGIHITDITDYIEADSDIDTIANDRMFSIYLPHRIYNMLPDELAVSCLNLEKNTCRKVLSIYFDFDEDNNLLNTELKREIIKINDNLTYKIIDKILKNFNNKRYHMFKIILDFCMKMKQERLDNNAIEMNFKVLNLKVNKSGKVLLKIRDQKSLSNIIVRELMLLYNKTAGKYLSENNIPAIYRVQKGIVKQDPFPIVYPASVTNLPGVHQSLGIDNYVQITSPLRRYTDLVLQRQLVQHINNKKILYDDKEYLLQIAKESEKANQTYKKLTQKIVNYWKYVYIEQNIDEIYNAEIKQIDNRNIEIYIEKLQKKFLIENNKKNINGKKVMVKATDADSELKNVVWELIDFNE